MCPCRFVSTVRRIFHIKLDTVMERKEKRRDARIEVENRIGETGGNVATLEREQRFERDKKLVIFNSVAIYRSRITLCIL